MDGRDTSTYTRYTAPQQVTITYGKGGLAFTFSTKSSILSDYLDILSEDGGQEYKAVPG